MCGSVDGWTVMANRSRYLGIAVLLFATINMVFAVMTGDALSILGSILGIISGSLVLCCGPSGLRYHTCVAEPPKFRYRTALELKGVGFDRVCDEALWVGLWYAMRTGGSTMLDGDGVLHHVRGPTPSPPERAAHT